MLPYWLLFAFPALMAIVYPNNRARLRSDAAQSIGYVVFILSYVLLAGLRYEIGGDWETYNLIYDDIRTDTLSYALTNYDPLFSLVAWLSAKFGTGIYLVNAICAYLLVYGVVRVSMRFREPWLALTMSVPYLLIVVGMGYVRQGAAIGMILTAIASFDQARPLRTVGFLIVAMGFHSTAIVAFPLFSYALAARYKAFAVIFAIIAAYGWIAFVAPRLNTFEVGYIDTEYESSGAFTRILMNVIPSALILLRWRHFGASERVRSVWVLVASANMAALAALYLSPSSTAVDRVALFFSPVQMAVLGEFRDLVPTGERGVMLVRLLLVAIAASVQVVWLVYATHAAYWVPYNSILQLN
jgi:EpsG family